MLLINRRGAATFILCRDCGESLRCPDCDLPFVYHLDGGTLRCHHCGRIAVPPERCPIMRRARGSATSAPARSGSRPSCAPVSRGCASARLDSDALAARRGFEAVYDDFREGRVDVLVGTQLAAKGLDLPRVTLAAVVAADVTLNLPDYRAAERTFQLLAQVAGRAGRGPMPGRVIIQTYAPAHYAVRGRGRAGRRRLRRRGAPAPPAARATRRSASWPACSSPTPTEPGPRSAAGRRRRPSRRRASRCSGPLPSYVARRAGRYRFQVVIRAPDAATRAAALERVPPGVAIDVDPESLL